LDPAFNDREALKERDSSICVSVCVQSKLSYHTLIHVMCVSVQLDYRPHCVYLCTPLHEQYITGACNDQVRVLNYLCLKCVSFLMQSFCSS